MFRRLMLTGKQRRHLRSLGHGLQSVLQIGKEGLTEGLIGAVDQLLEDHELIKIRVGQNATVDRKDAAQELSKMTGSETAQVLGSTILLYRKHPEKPKIKLPKAT